MAWTGIAFRYIQKNMQAFAGVGLAVAVCGSMVPQTLGLSQYRKAFTLYTTSNNSNQEEMPVDGHTRELIDKCLRRIMLRPEDEAGLTFFMSICHDVVHKGTVKLRFGAVIGLPATFAYQHVDDINKAALNLNAQPIDWDSEPGRRFADSIVLSDRAKAFAIAREIKYSSSFFASVDTILRVAFGLGAYTTGFILNNRLKLQQRLKIWARGGFYSFIAVAWGMLYLVVIDTYACWTDNRVDREVAKLTRAYSEGGVEYYTKLLARNQALRVLMGPSEGSKKYTLYGNEIETWRRSHVQLTSRRDNLVKYLSEYQQKPEVALNKDATDQSAATTS
jgi:hypothetical protein